MTNLNKSEHAEDKKIEEIKFYNQQYKLYFIDKHKDKIQDYNFYRRLFNLSKELEEELGRDLCDFSVEHINQIISAMQPSTSAAAAKNIAMIKRYLVHAAQDGEKMTNIIQINRLTHDAVQFLPSNPKYFISEAELQLSEDSCMNAQDAFLFRAVFEGIGGAEMIELRSLKMKDIDTDKNLVTIDLENYNKNRTVRVSERFVDIAMKAYNQTAYVLNNGEDVDEDFRRINSDYQLEPSVYILKKSNIGRIKHDEPVANPTIYKRLNTIKDFQSFKSIDKYYLKFNNIYKSGALFAGAKYIAEREMDIDNLSQSEWTEVVRFIKNTYLDLPVDPKNILTTDNIKELYAEEGRMVV